MTGVNALAYDCIVKGIYYSLNEVEKTAEVAKGDYTGNVDIPSEFRYNGITYSVTAIGNSAFQDCNDLASISIPSSIITIGDNAFLGCSKLVTVNLNSNSIVSQERDDESSIGTIFGNQVETYNLGDSVTCIGVYAFRCCTELKTITIPNSVTIIMERAFQACTGLKSVTIPNSVTSVNTAAFAGCTGLKSIVLSNAMKGIAQYAFRGCTNLTDITIPNNIIGIGNEAFVGCSGLADIVIPNSVTTIGDHAFSGCTGLTSITIPESMNTIREEAFSSCENLVTVNLNSNTFVSKNRKINTGLKKIFGEQVETYNIGEGISSIGDYAFTSCTNIKRITFPNSLTTIGNFAFQSCVGLTEVNIPDSLTNIGKYTFNGCSQLTSVTIGKGVTDIGERAFQNCINLQHVYCYADNIPTTGANSFNKANTGTLHVPISLLENYKLTEPWSSFNSIIALSEGVTLLEKINYTSSHGKSTDVYDIKGRRLDAPIRDLIIIRSNDGKVKKIMVK